MLILFETPAGFALFKASEKKLDKVDNIAALFETPEKAADMCVRRRCARQASRQAHGRARAPAPQRSHPRHRRRWGPLSPRCSRVASALQGSAPTPPSTPRRPTRRARCSVKLKAFYKFANTTEALSAAAAMVESKISSELKSFIKTNIVKKELTDDLAVADKALGGAIKEKFGLSVIADSRVAELMRGIRSQMTSLIDGLDETQLRAMQLGLGHTLSRYKLKFSPDKVDVMIVQAIGLLDDLDKEINTYAMRVKEWYGWHFPEMVKIVTDNLQYAQVVLKVGFRTNAAATDCSDILAPEVEEPMKEAAQVSMGTDISEEDIAHIRELGEQVVSLMEYRRQLWEYLQNRMAAIAPNLTTMVGELVGARLIAHAGECGCAAAASSSALACAARACTNRGPPVTNFTHKRSRITLTGESQTDYDNLL